MSNNVLLDENCLKLLSSQKCVVAVSGGSDSLALLLLLKKQSLAHLVAVTVDHGLRAEAAQEASYVQEICEMRGIPHVTLPVRVTDIGNLQANAREARYRALGEFCANEGISYLAIGHSLDDQVETFLLNAFRGSGVDGLSAMPVMRKGTPLLLRPALHLRRKVLQNFLENEGVNWIDDPSNDNSQFDRVKMRNWLKMGDELGFGFENIERTTANMSRMRDFLSDSVSKAAREVLEFSPLFVEARIRRQQFLQLHDELAMRLLAALCRYYGGSDYKPRLTSLENLSLSFQMETGSMTLEKTEFRWDENSVSVCAEREYLPPPTHSKKWYCYDYAGTLKPSENIGALGSSYRAFEDWRQWGISTRAAQTLPAILRLGAPVSADWSLFERESFWEFLKNS